MDNFLQELKASKNLVSAMRLHLPLAESTTLEACLNELKNHLGEKSAFAHVFLETSSGIELCGKTVEFYPSYEMKDKIHAMDLAMHSAPLEEYLSELCGGLCTVDALPTTDNRKESCTMVVFTIPLKGK